MILLPDKWPLDLALRVRRRGLGILGKIYFRLVHRKPWVGFLPSECAGGWMGSVDGEFVYVEGRKDRRGPILDLQWRVDEVVEGRIEFALAAVLRVPDQPERSLYGRRVEVQGSYGELEREVPREFSLLESRADELVSAMDACIPARKGLFDDVEPRKLSDRAEYERLLKWGEKIMASKEHDEARALLPVVAAIRADAAEAGALEFGRRACILLTQCSFAFKDGLWNPRWYAPLIVRALELADATLRRYPRNLAALIDRGTLRALLQDEEGALADYSEALRVDGTVWQTHGRRACVHERLGDAESALQDFDRAVDASGEDPDLRYGRSLLLQDLAAREPARKAEYCRKALNDLSTIPIPDDDQSWRARKLRDMLKGLREELGIEG